MEHQSSCVFFPPHKFTMNMNDLIDSVRRRPELWDKNNPHYRYKDFKHFLWKEVSRELNWEIGVYQLKNKWGSLRDVFRRELKKKPPLNGKKKKWEYFDKMMFLEAKMAQDEPENLNGGILDDSHPEIIIKTEEAGEEQTAEYSNDVEMTHTNNIETVVNEDNLEKQSTNGENGYEEDDYHFAMSLVPAMKRVPNDRKLRMRMKILQVLCEEGETNSFV